MQPTWTLRPGAVEEVAAMHLDVFGDLREWGEVLDMLEDLSSKGELDRYQNELARLVRYRQNWRIQQEALKSVPRIKDVSPLLVEATLEVLTDDHALLENRVYAADALGSILAAAEAGETLQFVDDRAIKVMEDMLDDGAPPILHAALRGAFEQAAHIQYP